MQVNFTINIDDRIINFFRKLFKKKKLVFMIMAIFASALVYAATITKPYTFATGDMIVADQINQNFDILYTKVNELDGLVTAVWSGNPDISYTGGNVGIGTTTPNTLLHIFKDSSTANTLTVENTGNYAGSDAVLFLDVIDGADIEVRAQRSPNVGIIDIPGGGLPLILQPSGGNVGIGTNPLLNILNKLAVKGRVAIGAAYAETSAPVEGLIVEGNVGIGTTSPNSKLAVVGLPSGTTRTGAGASGNLVGAVCITDTGDMYIDTDGSCAGN